MCFPTYVCVWVYSVWRSERERERVGGVCYCAEAHSSTQLFTRPMHCQNWACWHTHTSRERLNDRLRHHLCFNRTRLASVKGCIDLTLFKCSKWYSNGFILAQSGIMKCFEDAGSALVSLFLHTHKKWSYITFWCNPSGSSEWVSASHPSLLPPRPSTTGWAP